MKPVSYKPAVARNAKRCGKYHSMKEARRAQELQLLERGGIIAGLREQEPFDLYGRDGPLLSENGRQLRYVADFIYVENGETVIEDVKGYKDNVYKLKKSVMAAMGYRIRET